MSGDVTREEREDLARHVEERGGPIFLSSRARATIAEALRAFSSERVANSIPEGHGSSPAGALDGGSPQTAARDAKPGSAVPGELAEAVKALYSAAHWTADRPVDEAALWTAVRDAAGIEPGNSPSPRYEDKAVRRDELWQRYRVFEHGDVRGRIYREAFDAMMEESASSSATVPTFAESQSIRASAMLPFCDCGRPFWHHVSQRAHGCDYRPKNPSAKGAKAFSSAITTTTEPRLAEAQSLLRDALLFITGPYQSRTELRNRIERHLSTSDSRSHSEGQ